jgi:hypothetical protein
MRQSMVETQPVKIKDYYSIFATVDPEKTRVSAPFLSLENGRRKKWAGIFQKCYKDAPTPWGPF